MNRTVFFSYVRRAPFGGSLWQGQVEGLNKILDEWERRRLSDVRWLAYMLATVFHETGGKMQPVREAGGEKYLKSKPYYPWVGEGLVQVTWEVNARKFGATKPGQLMTWPIALKALFDGMLQGVFAGLSLDDFFHARKDDPVGARKIINGRDKAALIAGYHRNFLDAINASMDTSKLAEVDAEDAVPDDKPTSQSGTALAMIGGPVVTGTVIPAVLGIDNVYSLIFMLALLSIGGFAAFMFFSGRWSVTKSKAL
ncbi:hypothetical protein GYN07_21040 [Rhizobium leguminosarum bv. viciae 248]|uniref:hypothetical protein n=1 Tax=Rhizobium leguminosarum TaxID=384 RepID=UPI0003803BAB|nr:hypothetical protein [Rhizobium leguminosarum]QPZ93570.1 hypothetical protein GYN07_21040 [Rhizobium leguminosarum bv. viciae 248]